MSESWSNRLTITTEYSGIDGKPDDPYLQLHPNPTGGDVQLTLSADMSAVRVVVFDISGRTMQAYTLPAQTQHTTLATSLLPQGTYYVRIIGDRHSVVKKLIIR